MGEDDTCDQNLMTAGCIPCGLFALFFWKIVSAAGNWNARRRLQRQESKTVFNSANWLS
jgi:hypothetical protein